MKKVINVFDLNEALPFTLKIRMGIPRYQGLLTAKTPSATAIIIPDHSFSILAMYSVFLPNSLIPVYLFYMYNPWGSDLEKNEWEDSNPYLQMDSVRSQIPGINFEIKNDGLFFYSYRQFVFHFERIIIVDTLPDYEPFSVEVPLPNDVESDIEVEFSANKFEETFVYFDLLNDDLFKFQVQPYRLSLLLIFPMAFQFDTDIDSQFKINLLTKTDSFVYQGIVSLFSFLVPTFKIKVRVTKFNNDITDKLYLTFYARKGKVSIVSKPTFSSDCPNDCGGHGHCDRGSCVCDQNVIAILFYILNFKSIMEMHVH